jgi:stearoyl-CoA desaturase (Delta-9 desaturase)
MALAKAAILRRVSLALFVAMHFACLLVLVYPPTWGLLALAGGGYLLRMWGITVGYHRYLAHRSFKTSRAFRFCMVFIGAMAMQNGPLWWASWHRRHHKHADQLGDPHSPSLVGFWRSHIGWVFDVSQETDLSNVPDLACHAELRFLERYSWLPLVVYGLGCYALFGAAGLVWGFLVSTLAENHATFLINSLAHVWGTRRFATPDRSRNNALLALFTLGEGWHNNHHFRMSSARHGFAWWEIDMSYYSLKFLSWAGVVWAVRVPSQDAIRRLQRSRILRARG